MLNRAAPLFSFFLTVLSLTVLFLVTATVADEKRPGRKADAQPLPQNEAGKRCGRSPVR